MVPPHRRDEDRVAGIQFHRPRLRHRLGKARVRGQVGRVEIDQADRPPGGRVVDRPEIAVRELVRRKQRSEEHTSELQSLMSISYAVFCLKKKNLSNPTYPTKSTRCSRTPMRVRH